MKDILELKMVGPGLTGECHWPDAQHGRTHYFCGEPVHEGQSYCPSCARRATNPTRHFVDSQSLADAMGGGRSRTPNDSRVTQNDHDHIVTVDGYMSNAGTRLRDSRDVVRADAFVKRLKVVA